MIADRGRRDVVAAGAGIAFSLLLVVGVGSFQPDASAILAAAALVYIGASAIGSRVSARWWFIATGGPIALDWLSDGRLDATTALVTAGAALVVLGVARHTREQRTHPDIMPVQVFALICFMLLAAIGAALDLRLGAVLVAAGLLAHAAWDWWHHRSGQVVPRSYAMFCLTLDTTLAIGVLVTTF